MTTELKSAQATCQKQEKRIKTLEAQLSQAQQQLSKFEKDSRKSTQETGVKVGYNFTFELAIYS